MSSSQMCTLRSASSRKLSSCVGRRSVAGCCLAMLAMTIVHCLLGGPLTVRRALRSRTSTDRSDLVEYRHSRSINEVDFRELGGGNRTDSPDVRTIFLPSPGEKPKKRLPQAIIIGTGKCGTRALLEYLRLHPHIEAATREIHFFDRDVNFVQGLQWYREQMPPSYEGQITIEKSPGYVEHPRSPTEIYKMNKNTRLIWLVKDPVVRLMSAVAIQGPDSPHFYLRNDLSIKPENNAVCRGKYVVHLRNWLKVFPLSQFLFLDGGELVKDPLKQVKEVEKFLGLPSVLGPGNFYFNTTRGFHCPVPFKVPNGGPATPRCLKGSKGRRHPTLNDTVKQNLYNFYKPFNQELFKTIGKSFKWNIEDFV